MKKISKNILSSIFILLSLAFNSSLFSNTHHVSMSIENIKLTARTIEFDIFLANDGALPLSLSAVSYGLNVNPQLANSGILKCSYIDGSRSKLLGTISPYTLEYSTLQNLQHIRLTSFPIQYDLTPILAANQKTKIGRFIIENSNSWSLTNNSIFNFQLNNKLGLSSTQVLAFVDTDGTPIILNSSKKTLSVRIEENELTKSNMYESKHGILSMFPNPVSSTLNLTLNSSESEFNTFTITNTQGQVIKQIQSFLNKGENNLALDVQGITSGTYLLLIKGSKNIFQQNFVIL